MTTTTTTDPGFSRSVEATRAARQRDDLWSLADSLLAEVGQGSAGRDRRFEAIRQRCQESGVKPYSVSAMRQYRDVAAHWPPASRIEGLDFSHHRAALIAKDPAALLKALKAQHPEGVSVRQVSEAAKLERDGVAALAQQAQQKPASLTDFSAGALFDELAQRVTSGVKRQQVVSDLMASPGAAMAAKQTVDLLAQELEKALKAHQRKQGVWQQPAAKQQPEATPATPEATPAKSTGRPRRLRGL